MPQYRFDVDANTKKAEESINNLLGLMDKVDKAAKNAANVDDLRSDKNTLGLLNEFKNIEGVYDNLAKSARKFEQSNDFSGKTQSYQNFNDKLNETSTLLNKVSQSINKLGSNGGGNFHQYAADADRIKTSLGDSAKTLQDLQRINSRVRRLGNQQDRISDKVKNTHYMSERDVGTYTRNKKEIEGLSGTRDNINGLIYSQQAKYDELRKQVINGLNTDGKPMSSDELFEKQSKMKDIGKVIKKAQGVNTTIEATQAIGASSNTMVAGALKMVGSKAAPWLFAIDAGIEALKKFTQVVKEGEKVNKSTGEQALTIGNVSGHVSDSDMRGRVQKIMWNNGLGYNTQEGLDYYSLAIQSKGYDIRKDKDGQEASRRVNSLEVAGRATGVSDKTWVNAATAATQAGGILSDRDIQRLSETIAGENMRSGNSGDAEQNASIITGAIQQLSRSGTISMNNISNLSATSALLSRADKKLFGGEAGAQSINSLNQGFINASQGKDNALLWLMVQSNPTKYGKPSGLLKAQETLSEGLGNNENIELARNYIKMVGGSGEQGQAYGAFFLQNHFGYDPKRSDKLSRLMLDGKISNSEIKKEAEKIKKTGQTQTDKNLQSYQNSEQAGYNTQEAQGEALKSNAAGMVKWFRGVQNGVGKAVGGVFNVVGGGVGAGIRTISNFFNGGGTKSGAAGVNAGRGLLGTHTVHASTLSKKEIAADRSKSNKTRANGNYKPSDKSSAKTIAQKQQEESRTKEFLNTREEEKNLRKEKNNIDARTEWLKNFERILKEEGGGSGGGKAGTAGTVGKAAKDMLKDIDDKKKDDKKKDDKKSKGKGKSDSKGKGSSKGKTAKSKPKGTDKKISKSSSKKVSTKSLVNNNNITVNMPNGLENQGTVANALANKIATKVADYSRDLIRGD